MSACVVSDEIRCAQKLLDSPTCNPRFSTSLHVLLLSALPLRFAHAMIQVPFPSTLGSQFSRQFPLSARFGSRSSERLLEIKQLGAVPLSLRR
eukprot:4211242-Pyramimonas_sp.AAC.1